MNNGTFVNSRSYSSISASLRKRIPEFAKRYSYEKIYAALRVLGDIDKRQKTIPINEQNFYTLSVTSLNKQSKFIYTDEELIERFKAGDELAYVELVNDAKISY